MLPVEYGRISDDMQTCKGPFRLHSNQLCWLHWWPAFSCSSFRIILILAKYSFSNGVCVVNASHIRIYKSIRLELKHSALRNSSPNMVGVFAQGKMASSNWCRNNDETCCRQEIGNDERSSPGQKQLRARPQCVDHQVREPV